MGKWFKRRIVWGFDQKFEKVDRVVSGLRSGTKCGILTSKNWKTRMGRFLFTTVTLLAFLFHCTWERLQFENPSEILLKKFNEKITCQTRHFVQPNKLKKIK